MRSVRLRLLAMALLPLIVLLPLLLGITMQRWVAQFDDLLIAKVGSDLRVAEQYFDQIKAIQAAAVAATAQSVAFEAAQSRGGAALAEFIEGKRVELGLDFMLWATVSDPYLPKSMGEVALSATPRAPSASVSLLSAEQMAAISPALAERAAIPLVPTEAARPIARDVESRGMFMLAAHRSADSENILIGGRLLNRNLDVIDTMNALVYRGEGGEVSRTGTTTLFLDDVRISTNVRLFEGSRALGTRVSEAVWRRVMENGQTWLNRAFVVNDWYISGYMPLTDISGDRIGMLYTGFLEAPHLVITDGQNGQLVDFFDIPGWSAALIEALEAPHRFAAMRAAARETIVARYDLRRHCLPRMVEFVERPQARPGMPQMAALFWAAPGS